MAVWAKIENYANIILLRIRHVFIAWTSSTYLSFICFPLIWFYQQKFSFYSVLLMILEARNNKRMGMKKKENYNFFPFFNGLSSGQIKSHKFQISSAKLKLKRFHSVLFFSFQCRISFFFFFQFHKWIFLCLTSVKTTRIAWLIQNTLMLFKSNERKRTSTRWRKNDQSVVCSFIKSCHID